MKLYRVHVPLSGFRGRSGRVYSCTRGALVSAPEGDLKALGHDKYSLHESEKHTVEGAGDSSSREETQETPSTEAPSTD